MARTAVTATALVPNAGIAPAQTTIDATLVTNGVKLTTPQSGGRLLLVVANTHSAPHAVILRAGADPPAGSGVGDLSVSITNATTQYLGPFESYRFAQKDGSLNVDFGAGFTGTIEAYTWPQGY